MSEENKSVNSGGIGFCGMLAILFIGLKLGGLVTWSWWWVLAPLWAPLAVIAVICLICVFVYGVYKLCGGK